MTLVLALRWSDGVVLVSDGQATSDAAGQPTGALADAVELWRVRQRETLGLLGA